MTAPRSAKLAPPRLWPMLATTPMIRSMTGFARRERQFPWGLLAWELKTVNHRFLEMGCRLPEEFRAADAELLSSLIQRAQAIASQTGNAARIDVLDVLRWPGVIRDGSRDPAPMIA